MSRDRLRVLLACLATLALVLPLAYLWQHSRVGSTYTVMDMGYPDYGGGPRGMGVPGMAGMAGMAGMDRGGHSVSVADLTTRTDRPADRVVHLVARQQTIRLADGQRVQHGFTLNGRSPGPLIEVTQGQLLEVHVLNADVSGGLTLHWHGMDVPNAEDGVAGVTQDAVLPGRSYTYRFVAKDAGTYWYHSHQVSHEQVVGGLLGPIVVRPRHPDPGVKDVVALSHTYDGAVTLNGLREVPVEARPGQRVRVRVINTDNGPTRTWANVPYRLVAVDGRDVNRPTEVRGKAVLVTAGGRDDLEVVAPRDGSEARVQVGASTAVVVGRGDTRSSPVQSPKTDLDLLSYGTPTALPFDPAEATRHFRYAIGRRPGFVRGKPGLWWSVNGHLFPHLPMFVVREGDVVVMHISNSSGDVHPMHLHGHHAVVLRRNGVKATGSPWWFDSLNVENGESYDVAFLADNPGIWMDHCHNLNHAQQGLVTHLMYAGVTDPYRVGGTTGNEPE